MDIIDLKKYLSEKNFKSVPEWKNHFSDQLSARYNTKTYSFNFEKLYRARRFNKISESDLLGKLKNTSELWAPPRKFAFKNRFNLKGIPLLYCSTDPLTLFYELSAQRSDYIAIMEYTQLEDIRNMTVVGANVLINSNGWFNKILGNHFSGNSKVSLELDDMLSTVCQIKKSEIEDVNIYDLTIAIGQILLYKGKDITVYGKTFPSASRHTGILYPSVASQLCNSNVALLPDCVKSILRPAKIYIYKIENLIEDRYYDMRLIYQSDKILLSNNTVTRWNKSNVEEHITDIPIHVNLGPGY